MAPLHAWENANPSYEVSTRRRGIHDSYRRCDEPNQRFCGTPTSTDDDDAGAKQTSHICQINKENTDSQNTVKKPKTTGLGRGKSLPKPNRPSSGHRSLARDGTSIHSAAWQPRGRRGRFTPKRPKLQVQIDRRSNQRVNKATSNKPPEHRGSNDSPSVQLGVTGETVSQLVCSAVSVTNGVDELDQEMSDADRTITDVENEDDTAEDEEDETIKRVNAVSVRVNNANRTYQIIAEVALKGALLSPLTPSFSTAFGPTAMINPHANILNLQPSPAFPSFSTNPQTTIPFFDEYGTLSQSLTLTATTRATSVRAILTNILNQKREQSLTVHGNYDITAFIRTIAAFIPQIQFLSENGMGDQPDEQKEGINAAWDVCLEILRIVEAMTTQSLAQNQYQEFLNKNSGRKHACFQPQPKLMVWTVADFSALYALDRLMRKTLGKKVWISRLAHEQQTRRDLLENTSIQLQRVSEALARATLAGDESWFFGDFKKGVSRAMERGL